MHPDAGFSTTLVEHDLLDSEEVGASGGEQVAVASSATRLSGRRLGPDNGATPSGELCCDHCTAD